MKEGSENGGVVHVRVVLIVKKIIHHLNTKMEEN